MNTHWSKRFAALAAIAAAFTAPVAFADADADTAVPPAFERVDYADLANWLCHPGKEADACSVELDTTEIGADGSTRVIPFTAAARPPVDCFYLYPTVSSDPLPNSDMDFGPEENTAIQQQFARFAAACRPYAPGYRQMTRLALQAWMRFGRLPTNRAMRYADARDAWRAYLANHNEGRGVILIGHSQGANLLKELVEREIAGEAAQERIVSVMAIGGDIALDTETGAFGPFAPCETADETGCLISYVSFSADAPPTEAAFFGRAKPDGRRAACVNPAALNGGDTLDARFAAGRLGGVDTPFASMPGLASANCVATETHDYLAITPAPADPRAGVLDRARDLPADWGLHRVDMHLAIGDLVAIAAAQGRAWAAR
ncbi:MAG: DUF3089 domain-containing protein [Pseudomonadota bacterium]